MTSFFSAVEAFLFEIDILKPNCLAVLSPLGKYIATITSVIVVLLLNAGVYVVHTTVVHRGRFRDQAPALLYSSGTIMMAFLMSVVSLMLRPLQAYLHPNGERTIMKYPTVLWGASEHSSMLLVAAVSLLIPIGFVASTCWAVRQYPARVMLGDTRFFRCWHFVFYRFSMQTYWYGPILNLRSVAIAVGPVLPMPFVQVTFLQLVLAISMALTTFLLPWRIWHANVIDSSCSLCLLLVLTLACFFADDRHLSEVVQLCFIIILTMLCLVPVGLISVGGCFLLQAVKKAYRFFVCHHKIAAGALARLLKMRLGQHIRPNEKVFVDSDDLKDRPTGIGAPFFPKQSLL